MNSFRKHAHWLFALTPIPLFLFDGQPSSPYLPEDTQWHYLFALLSAAGFFLILFFQNRSVSILSLMLSSLFVGTIGMVLLIAFQYFAAGSFGFELSGGGLSSMVWVFLVRLIAFSYQCIREPDSGPLLTFLGYTAGVGLCEEICKVLPVLFAAENRRFLGWRDSMAFGLACGIGFGVSEGIHFAATQYNGNSGPEIYIVRFISCVGLHAIWTGISTVLIVRGKVELDDGFWRLLKCLGLSILAHGLYNTFLTYEQTQMAARIVAGASFFILMAVIQWRK